VIKSLNLSLSGRCTARCVYCPSDRGQHDSGMMSSVLVLKLMTEIRSPDFPWKIQNIQLGENGDALLNPQFNTITSFIRHCLPSAQMDLTTNMVHMKPSLGLSILESKALDSIGLNIDGHDAESYEAQKGLRYDTVMSNFMMFMKYREVYQPDLRVTINVLPLKDYYNKVLQRFGFPPIEAPSDIPPSSFEQVHDSLKKLDWITEDVFIRRSPVFFWAERDLPMDFDLTKYRCPQLPRVEQEAFISPSGQWYPCCLDANQDQAFGNVSRMTLREVHDSPARLEFIQRLKDQEFSEIGYPCNRVPFCEGML